MSYEHLAKSIKKRIREIRGLSQKQVAKEIGLTQNEISRLFAVEKHSQKLEEIKSFLDKKYPKEGVLRFNSNMEIVEDDGWDEEDNRPEIDDLLSLLELNLFQSLVEKSEIPKDHQKKLISKLRNLSLERFYK